MGTEKLVFWDHWRSYLESWAVIPENRRACFL